MTSELKDYISKCDICLAHWASPGKEPLLQHEFIACPWSKIGADLCELHGRTLLVVCDYYSNFFEVERINKVTTRGVIKVLNSMFSQCGAPNVVISDNGPQFDLQSLPLLVRYGNSNTKRLLPVTLNRTARLRMLSKLSNSSLRSVVQQVSQSIVHYWIGAIHPRRV